jgi:hypothetical protein
VGQGRTLLLVLLCMQACLLPHIGVLLPLLLQLLPPQSHGKMSLLKLLQLPLALVVPQRPAAVRHLRRLQSILLLLLLPVLWLI